MDKTVITVIPPTTYGTFKVSSINAFSSGVSPTASPTSRPDDHVARESEELLDTDADSQILVADKFPGRENPSNQCNTDQAATNRTIVWNAIVPRSLKETFARDGMMEPKTATIMRP